MWKTDGGTSAHRRARKAAVVQRFRSDLGLYVHPPHFNMTKVIAGLQCDDVLRESVRA